MWWQTGPGILTEATTLPAGNDDGLSPLPIHPAVPSLPPPSPNLEPTSRFLSKSDQRPHRDPAAIVKQTADMDLWAPSMCDVRGAPTDEWSGPGSRPVHSTTPPDLTQAPSLPPNCTTPLALALAHQTEHRPGVHLNNPTVRPGQWQWHRRPSAPRGADPLPPKLHLQAAAWPSHNPKLQYHRRCISPSSISPAGLPDHHLALRLVKFVPLATPRLFVRSSSSTSRSIPLAPRAPFFLISNPPNLLSLAKLYLSPHCVVPVF
ncbi:hypothetical protein B0T11DRAFT_7677 [Plectosphaerella cucumerina]|uniref:Uncharacterized protein n=1 Tax=Plectosphaerella cucumerina TaxID=40658 RepID=A0A8K0X7X4_9PEZI|nr:hypothetical protein B0T11DRAFT_7677 [Plectosphaerella cucumerina]